MKKIEIKINEVYNFTSNYISKFGYPPSVREICNKLSIKSTATASYYLDKLVSRGLLEKSPSKNRALTLPQHASQFKSVPIVGTINAGQTVIGDILKPLLIPGYGSGRTVVKAGESAVTNVKPNASMAISNGQFRIHSETAGTMATGTVMLLLATD